MRRVYGSLALFLISFFFSCQKEASFIGGPDTPTFTGETVTPDPITAALQGNVFDETGTPAAGVTVQAGSKTATTNTNGYFRINDAALDKKSAVVMATKTGYFKAYRTFAATAGANNIEIKLVKRALTGSIDAATGGEVSLPNGSKVALSAGGVVNAATNAAYTGSVKVYAAYIDPSSADIAQTIPGSFMATDKDGKRVTLASYGMVAVELESSTGEKLQIKSGATAKLTTAIPSSAQASAPATIALWYVDESTGIWKEEGTANKNGNVYVGDVKHFSFWNCDVSANAVMLSMKLQLPSGEPLVHADVIIRRPSTNWFVHGYTDSLGQVNGYVPYNEPLEMYVVNACQSPIYSQNIGPFIQNTNIGTINVTIPPASLVTVKGKLLNCSNAAVSNGYALISFGDYTRHVSANATGDFQTTFTYCGNASPATVDVIGVDKANQQQGTNTSVAVVSPITNTGNITACGISTVQFMNYTLDGTTYSVSSGNTGYLFDAYTDSVQSGTTATTSIRVYSQTNSFDRLNFTFRGAAAPGTYQLINLMAQNYNTAGGAVGVTLVSPSNVVLTTFPQGTGQFYEGSINSTFKDSLNVTHSLNGTFKVLRQ